MRQNLWGHYRVSMGSEGLSAAKVELVRGHSGLSSRMRECILG